MFFRVVKNITSHSTLHHQDVDITTEDVAPVDPSADTTNQTPDKPQNEIKDLAQAGSEVNPSPTQSQLMKDSSNIPSGKPSSDAPSPAYLPESSSPEGFAISKRLKQTPISSDNNPTRETKDGCSPPSHQVMSNESGDIPIAVIDESATLSSTGVVNEVDPTSLTQAIMKQLEPSSHSGDHPLSADADRPPSFLPSQPLDLRSYLEPHIVIPKTVTDESATPAAIGAAHELQATSATHPLNHPSRDAVLLTLQPFQHKGRSNFTI